MDFRVLKRKHLLYYLQVEDRDKGEKLGFIVDITTQGIMIMSKAPVETEKLHHLRIDLDTALIDKEYLDCVAFSRWCKKSINDDFYDTGFEFINLSPEISAEIEDIIKSLGLRD